MTPARRPGRAHQGAALLSAMLVVTLAASLAATALARQWRQTEAESAQRTQQQVNWLLSGLQDWARQILREDAQAGATDHLQEPWARARDQLPLTAFLGAPTEDAADGPDAILGLRISDAQARLNVNNLVDGTEPSAAAARAFARLFRTLALPQSELDALIGTLHQARLQGGGDAALLPQHIGQLRWLGLSDATIDALRPHVVVLPERTPLNVNTASAEVIHAAVPQLAFADARRLVSARMHSPFSNAEAALQVAGLAAIPVEAVSLSVNSRYFEVRGALQLQSSRIQVHWLMLRDESDVLTLSQQRQPQAQAGVPAGAQAP
jgi:general secretion pathway protein K